MVKHKQNKQISAENCCCFTYSSLKCWFKVFPFSLEVSHGWYLTNGHIWDPVYFIYQRILIATQMKINITFLSNSLITSAWKKKHSWRVIKDLLNGIERKNVAFPSEEIILRHTMDLKAGINFQEKTSKVIPWKNVLAAVQMLQPLLSPVLHLQIFYLWDVEHQLAQHCHLYHHLMLHNPSFQLLQIMCHLNPLLVLHLFLMYHHLQSLWQI